MKKTIVIITLLLIATGVWAQKAPENAEKGRFAVGATMGLPEGIGVTAAVRVTDYVQFRAGYSIVPFSYNKVLSLDNAMYIVNQGTPNERIFDFSRLPVKATLLPGGMGNVLADFFPGRKTNFHFTLGCFIASNKLLRVRADMREIVSPEDWGTFAVNYQGVAISTDPKGYAYLGARTPNFLPYLGVGFGRAVASERIKFTVDAGLIYTEGIEMVTYNFVHKDVKETQIHSSTLVDKEGNYLDQRKMIDWLSGFPILPMIRVNLYVKLF